MTGCYIGSREDSLLTFTFMVNRNQLTFGSLKISCFFMINIMRGFILYFVLLMKSHLQSYPCPLQINSFWNLGFLLGIAIILQIITGIFLGLHYTSDLNSAYSSIFFFIREIFYGLFLYFTEPWVSSINYCQGSP